MLPNFSTVSQNIATTTRTYLAGSMVTILSPGLQIGSKIRWTFDMTKTLAGLAASTIDIAFGTTGTVTDLARVSFAKNAGTAVVDEGNFIIECLIRGPLSASGVAVGFMTLKHNLATTGMTSTGNNTVVTVSSAFDVTFANCTRVGLCLTTGLNDNVTIQSVKTETWSI